MRPVGKWAREIAQLRVIAVVGVPDLDGERGPREAGADRGCGVGAAGAVGQLERVAVGECDVDGHLSRWRLPARGETFLGRSHPCAATASRRVSGASAGSAASDHSASSPSASRRMAPAPSSSIRARSAASTVGELVVVRHDRRHLLGDEAGGEAPRAHRARSRRAPGVRASCRGWRSARRRPRSTESRPPPGARRLTMRSRRSATAPSSARARRSGGPCPGSRWGRPAPGASRACPARRRRRWPRASIAATIASTSRSSTRASASAISASSSSSSVVVNQASCSARSASSSRPGAISRVATIARQAREVASTRARGASSSGMPKRLK